MGNQSELTEALKQAAAPLEKTIEAMSTQLAQLRERVVDLERAAGIDPQKDWGGGCGY